MTEDAQHRERGVEGSLKHDKGIYCLFRLVSRDWMDAVESENGCSCPPTTQLETSPYNTIEGMILLQVATAARGWTPLEGNNAGHMAQQATEPL